jgi:hypothetical protein
MDPEQKGHFFSVTAVFVFLPIWYTVKGGVGGETH